jgi:lipoate synthase
MKSNISWERIPIKIKHILHIVANALRRSVIFEMCETLICMSSQKELHIEDFRFMILGDLATLLA